MDANLKKKSMQAVIDYQFAPLPSYSEAVAEVKGDKTETIFTDQ